MGARPTGRVALMAIHPEFADAILDGRKTVEFRKRSLASDVNAVAIYATAPVSKIIGEFQLDGTVLGSPAELWARVGDRGAIAPGAYDSYFSGSQRAVGLLVGKIQRYDHPLALCELCPEPAVPQSFTYLVDSQVEALRAYGLRRSAVARLADALARLVTNRSARRPSVTVSALPPPVVSDERATAAR